MEELNLDLVARHRGLDTAASPWNIPDPRECAMIAEEGMSEDEERTEALDLFLSYCFADAEPAEWRLVACRAHAAIATLWPHTIAMRSQHEILDARTGARAVHGFPLGDLVRRFEVMEVLGEFDQVIAFFFPDSRAWLLTGTQHLYLVARLYAPGLVTRWKGDLTFEQMAGVFGEIPLPPEGEDREAWIPPGWDREAWHTARDRARSRWSARAQNLITRKIESVGASRPQMFGKGATVAGKYRQAALGNSNRRGNAERTRGANQNQP